MLLTTLRTNRRPAARRAGFTLLEVLVVVAILVILASVATIATQRYLMDAKKSRAHLGCKNIDQAIESFMANTANPNGVPPQGLQELLQPHFGGQSLLRNGQADLIDPWGQQYQTQIAQRADGTEYILVMTTAPDGTPISQFGIGNFADPRMQGNVTQ
jgi:general secretion pathway protein G